MYTYVTQQKVAPCIKTCEAVFAELKTALKTALKSEVTVSDIELIGSGARNMVTCDADDAVFDLDYNLKLGKLNGKWANNLLGLKSFIKSTLDKLLQKAADYDFKDGSDSTSALTYEAFHKRSGKKAFGFDLAIFIIKDTKDSYLLLKHDKISNLYILNERKIIQNQKEKAALIKKMQLWSNLRERYLKYKNSSVEESSWELYQKALNEVYVNAKNARKKMKKMAKVSGNTHTTQQMNHHANQANSNNAAHQAALNNHANQCNPNNSAYNGGKGGKKQDLNSLVNEA